MKLVCVGRNYAEHARELGNEMPEEPVLFIKPDTALLPPGAPFTIPAFSSDVHHEIELVLRISLDARDVPMHDAMAHVDAITIGLDFTARDVQSRCKAKGLPWEISKAFDGSAAIGSFVPLPHGVIDFSLQKNGQTVQSGKSSDMLHGFESLLSYASRFFTLRRGDLLFTGTPAGVAAVAPGDVLEGYLEEERLLRCEVRS